MKNQKQATKQVNVIYTYKFNKINRICFTVLSSNEQDHYNTCFNGDENHGSCSCPALRGCYHLDGLKARAAEYFQSRQPAQPEKANPVAEAEAFIAKVQAEKAVKQVAPLHNNVTERTFESAPSGRLVPMR